MGHQGSRLHSFSVGLNNLLPFSMPQFPSLKKKIGPEGQPNLRLPEVLGPCKPRGSLCPHYTPDLGCSLTRGLTYTSEATELQPCPRSCPGAHYSPELFLVPR